MMKWFVLKLQPFRFEMDNDIVLRVKTLDGKEHTVKASRQSSVQELKVKIEGLSTKNKVI